MHPRRCCCFLEERTGSLVLLRRKGSAAEAEEAKNTPCKTHSRPPLKKNTLRKVLRNLWEKTLRARALNLSKLL